MRYIVKNETNGNFIKRFEDGEIDMFSSRAKAQRCANEFQQSAIAEFKGYTYAVLPETVLNK